MRPATGLARPLAALIAPATTNLLERWVADDLALGAVASWASRQAGGHALAQATSSMRPVCTAGGPGGHQYALFDGVDDFLQTAAFTLAQPWVCVAIYRLLTVGAAAVHDTVFDGHAIATGALLADSAPKSYINAGTSLTWSGTAVAAAAYESVVVTFNGASSSLRSSRTDRATGNAGASAAGGFTLGALATGGRSTNLAVLEVLIYSAALSTSDRTKTETYATATYGVV